jgi:asparagine synthase (glutamine-hydrolysing)
MLGLSIPDSLKIRSPEDGLRKLILRKASADLGLPKKIAEAPKKAIQYSTGIDKCIKKLARCRGLKTEDYLKTIFKEEFAGIQLH